MVKPIDFSDPRYSEGPSPEEGLVKRGKEASIGASEASAMRANVMTPLQAQALALSLRKGERAEQKDIEAAAAEKAAQAEAAITRQEQMASYLGNIQRVRDLLTSPTATGPAGQLLGNIWGSKSSDLRSALESLTNPIVLDTLQAARKGSKVGATGFGALSEKELGIIAATWGSLKQAQSPEQIRPILDRLENHYRRFFAYNAGYDPAKAEGAALVGLPMPKGAKAPEPVGGAPRAGEWKSNPELAGVDAAVASMIKGGRSADQIRQWMNEYQPGLGDRALNLESSVEYWKRNKQLPGVAIEREFVPSNGPLSSLSGAPAAFGVGAGEQATAGFLGEMTGDRARAEAVQRGLEAQHPVAYTLGSIAGAVPSAVVGEALLAKYGLRLPALLQGLPQNMLYGAGSAEPGERLSGAVSEGLATPVENLFGQGVGKVVGGSLRGGQGAARVLAERYGLRLTPGQFSSAQDDLQTLAGGYGPDLSPGEFINRKGLESRMAGWPIVGPQIRARRNESLVQFNKAAFDEALADVGGKVSAIGQPGIAEAQDIVGNAYKQALDGVTLTLDTPFAQQARGKAYSDLSKLRDVGPEIARETDAIFAKYADPSGAISGEGVQNALQELTTLKNAYKNDPRWARSIAPKIDDISDAYAGLLERQAPDNYKLFRNANTAYRNVSILQKAVEAAPDADIFMPGHLRSATRQGTQRFGGVRASARGDRPFNELSKAGLKVLPKKIDETSLGAQMLTPALAGGAGAGYIGLSNMAQPDRGEQTSVAGEGAVPAPYVYGLGAAALASLPYTKGGMRMLTAPLRGGRTPTQRKLGELFETYFPSAFRGAYRGATAEPGVPMPENFDYSKVGGPQLQETISKAAAAPVPAEAPAEAPTEEGGPRIETMGGRTVLYDPATKQAYDIDTGEPIEGLRHGGPVSGFAYSIGR